MRIIDKEADPAHSQIVEQLVEKAKFNMQKKPGGNNPKEGTQNDKKDK